MFIKEFNEETRRLMIKSRIKFVIFTAISMGFAKIALDNLTDFYYNDGLLAFGELCEMRTEK